MRRVRVGRPATTMSMGLHRVRGSSGRRLLLLSNSSQHGRGYLDHAEAEIRALLAGVGCVLFVPFALADHDGYASRCRQRLNAMGYEVDSVHTSPDVRAAVEQAEAVFIGGGNTFRLLKALYDNKLIETIRRRVDEGMPYLGASAGTNVAAPTIRTTNDMPIVEAPSLDALGLVGFQINPHYLDPDPGSSHMGETREQRLLEYLEENEIPVLGLREGSMLRISNEGVRLLGERSARWFQRVV